MATETTSVTWSEIEAAASHVAARWGMRGESSVVDTDQSDLADVRDICLAGHPILTVAHATSQQAVRDGGDDDGVLGWYVVDDDGGWEGPVSGEQIITEVEAHMDIVPRLTAAEFARVYDGEQILDDPVRSVYEAITDDEFVVVGLGGTVSGHEGGRTDGYESVDIYDIDGATLAYRRFGTGERFAGSYLAMVEDVLIDGDAVADLLPPSDEDDGEEEYL